MEEMTAGARQVIGLAHPSKLPACPGHTDFGVMDVRVNFSQCFMITVNFNRGDKITE